MRKQFTDGRMDAGWYTENRNLATESHPSCYGITGLKACKNRLIVSCNEETHAPSLLLIFFFSK